MSAIERKGAGAPPPPPLHPRRHTATAADRLMCHVCKLDAVVPGNAVKLPCGHAMHVACIPCNGGCVVSKEVPEHVRPYTVVARLSAEEIAKLGIPDPADARTPYPHGARAYIKAVVTKVAKP